MAAKYQFFKNPPSKEQAAGEGAILHPRIVESDVIRFEKLCERIASRSTFSAGEVMGIMALFKEELVNALSDGDQVEVEGIGSFSTVIRCAPIRNPKEIRAESIHFSRVIFKACKEMRKEMSVMRFERAPGYQAQETYTTDQRQGRILWYLQNNPGIQSSTCMRLNGCSRYVAQADLKAMMQSAKIRRLGGPKVAVYVLPDKE